MSDSMTVGQRIKAARKKAGMTQKELGVKLGIASQGIAQWENDLRKPKYENLKRIAVAIGVSLEELQGTVFSPWISVKERLPEEWKAVLVWSDRNFVECAVYIGIPGKWRVTWNHTMMEPNTITHWMPLPEPPQEV